MRSSTIIALCVALLLGACEQNPSLLNLTADSWAAARDGETEWRTVGAVDGAYTYTARNDRWSLVLVCSIGDDTSIFVVHATKAELPSYRSADCAQFSGVNPFQVGGTVRGLTASENATVAFGTQRAQSSGGVWAVLAWAGTYDLMAALEGGDDYPVATKLIIQRDVEITANRNLPVDFGQQGIALETQPIDVTGDDQVNYGLISVDFISQRGTRIPLGTAIRDATTTPTPIAVQFPLVPSSQQLATETHRVEAYVQEAGKRRAAARYFKAPAPVTLALPGNIEVADVDVNGQDPYPRLRAAFSEVANASVYSVEYQQIDRIRRTFIIILTTGYLAGTTTHTISDFATAPGWKSQWSPVSGRPVAWRMSAFVSSSPTQTVIDAAQGRLAPDGTEIKLSERNGVYVF